MADYLQVFGSVIGENDLKPLVMYLEPVLNYGTVVLNINSSAGKIWKDPAKGFANLVLIGPGSKTWNLGDSGQKSEFLSLCSSLQVEGAAGAVCDIKLSYLDLA